MSGPDRNPADEVVRDPNPDQIRAELAALGELGLDDDDDALAFALDGGRDLDIATVQTLAGWAEAPSAESPELSELAQARVWRTIELRTKDAPGEPVERDRAPAPAPRRSGRSGVLLAAVALVAVAAAVVLVPTLRSSQRPQSTPQPVAKAPTLSAEELDVLSTQARAGLAALDRLSGTPRGTARVEAMAADYARRLEAEGLGRDDHQGSRG